MATSVKQMIEAADAVVPRITPQVAQELMMAGDVLVVDVRDAPEVAREGKVAGAINISRGLLEFRADPASASHDPQFRTDRPVIVYCASGHRAAMANAALHVMGLDNVRVFPAGYGAWEAAGEPTE